MASASTNASLKGSSGTAGAPPRLLESSTCPLLLASGLNLFITARHMPSLHLSKSYYGPPAHDIAVCGMSGTPFPLRRARVMRHSHSHPRERRLRRQGRPPPAATHPSLLAACREGKHESHSTKVGPPRPPHRSIPQPSSTHLSVSLPMALKCSYCVSPSANTK